MYKLLQRQFIIYSILFCTILSSAQTPESNSPDIKFKRDVDLTFHYKLDVKRYAGNVFFKVRIPSNIKNRQTVNSVKYSLQPDSVYTIATTTYAIYKLHNLEKNLKINIKCNLTIYKYVPEKVDTSIHEDFSEYLKPERFIETELPAIKNLAASLKNKDDIETIMNTYKYIHDNISYMRKDEIGAANVLETGVGKCTDFSDLFVALLRANKIPAKSMHGAVVVNDINPLHAWAEAYSKKQGWIMFDPTIGAMHVSQFGNKYSIKVKNQYVILCEKRYDPEMFNQTTNFAYRCADYNDLIVKLRVTLEDH